MQNHTVRIESIEQLVEQALKFSRQRWTLESRTERSWADPVAGNAWEKRRDDWRAEMYAKANELGCTSYQVPGYEELERQIVAERPEEPAREEFHLSECGDGWHGWTIYLPDELGKEISKFWLKKNYRYIGVRTLPSILAKLGKTDVKEQIAAAQKREEEKREKNRRNWARKEVLGANEKMLTALNQCKESKAISQSQFDALTTRLADITNGVGVEES